MLFRSEGTEVDIFSYGRETLGKIKPDILCEVLPSSRQVDAYEQILDGFSYQKYQITNAGLIRRDKITPDLQYKDWFFTTQHNLDIKREELLKS